MNENGRKIRLVNLTPHELVVFIEDKPILRVPLGAKLLRLKEVRLGDERVSVDGVPIEIRDLDYGAPDAELPDEVEGVYYVVSRIAANSMRDRRDILFPMDDVRNKEGAIIGCRRFARLAT